MKRFGNSLRLAFGVTWLAVVCCPLFAYALPMTGDRYQVSFPSQSFAHAEFTLGNQLAGGNFLIEDFTIRIVGSRWDPSDMLQGFYHPSVNWLVACLDAVCTQFSVTVSRSGIGEIEFGNVNHWIFEPPPTPGLGAASGAYNVNPVPTDGTYTVALNALSCSNPPCDPLLSSGAATFALGSQLAGGNYEIQGLIVELGLFFSPSDVLQGFYNPQVNRLVACLDAGCTQFSVTVSRSEVGEIEFGNSNEWSFLGNNGFGDAHGTYAISPVSAPGPPTYAMVMAGLVLLGTVARRRKQRAIARNLSTRMRQ